MINLAQIKYSAKAIRDNIKTILEITEDVVLSFKKLNISEIKDNIFELEGHLEILKEEVNKKWD